MQIFNDQTIPSLKDAILRREISAAELCRHVLEEVSEQNPKYAILTDTLATTALLEAEVVDRRISAGDNPGRLAGIPIVIKDNIDTVPATCSAGLPSFAGYKPQRDAAVVGTLRKEGAVIIGVAATDSGAFGVTTPAVRNPVYPGRIAGGSSGGPAAAVAAGFCKAAIGTDTGGSIRIPSACCGIAGLKPTFGLIPSDGVRPLSKSADHVGPLARRIVDLGAILEIFAGQPAGLVPREKRKKIGVPWSYFADAAAEVCRTVEDAAIVCEDLGHDICEVEIPHPDDVIPTHMILALSEAALVHLEFDQDIHAYPDVARTGIRLGRSYRSHEYLAASNHRRDFVARISSAFDRVDYLLMPTLPILPPGEGTSQVEVGGRGLEILAALIRYTAAFDQSGNPALSMPWRAATSEQPGSIQLVGPLHGDLALLAFAHEIEEERDRKSKTDVGTVSKFHTDQRG